MDRGAVATADADVRSRSDDDHADTAESGCKPPMTRMDEDVESAEREGNSLSPGSAYTELPLFKRRRARRLQRRYRSATRSINRSTPPPTAPPIIAPLGTELPVETFWGCAAGLGSMLGVPVELCILDAGPVDEDSDCEVCTMSELVDEVDCVIELVGVEDMEDCDGKTGTAEEDREEGGEEDREEEEGRDDWELDDELLERRLVVVLDVVMGGGATGLGGSGMV